MFTRAGHTPTTVLSWRWTLQGGACGVRQCAANRRWVALEAEGGIRQPARSGQRPRDDQYTSRRIVVDRAAPDWNGLELGLLHQPVSDAPLAAVRQPRIVGLCRRRRIPPPCLVVDRGLKLDLPTLSRRQGCRETLQLGARAGREVAAVLREHDLGGSWPPPMRQRVDRSKPEFRPPPVRPAERPPSLSSAGGSFPRRRPPAVRKCRAQRRIALSIVRTAPRAMFRAAQQGSPARAPFHEPERQGRARGYRGPARTFAQGRAGRPRLLRWKVVGR